MSILGVLSDEQGIWFDFKSGERYDTEEGRWIIRYGDLLDIPIFARAGAIIPMVDDGWKVRISWRCCDVVGGKFEELGI